MVAKSVYVASLFALLAFGATGVTSATAASVQLIGGVAETADAATAKLPAKASRARLVRLDTSALFDGSSPRSADAVPEISFDLFDNAKFTGIVKTVQQDGGATTWQGDLKGVGNGYFYVVAVDGAVIIHVASPRGIFEVSNAGGGLYRVIEVDSRKNGEDFPADLPVGKAPHTSLQNDATPAGAAPQIDVVVFYTDAARAAEGSTAAIRARVALAVAETNTAYAQSGITPRLRLVHTEEISYVESGSIDIDLERLLTSGDGYLDQVQAVRDTFGADMVSLITENGGGYCGMASSIMANADNAYDVTARDCATGYYSFGHEFGHLQGARHDAYVDWNSTPFAYAHGYTHPSGDELDSWRTVMAYNSACADTGYDCTRLQYFSNPRKSYRRAAMGSAGTAENYRVLNKTAATVSGFRPTVIGNAFQSTFNGPDAGWTKVSGAWTTGPQYITTAGVASKVSSISHSGQYGDLIFSAKLRRTGCLRCDSGLVIRGNPSNLNDVKDWKPGYQFRFTNNGSFAVVKVDAAGAYTGLVPWTSTSAIVKDGWNTLRVVAVGNMFNFYINGVSVWQGQDGSAPLAVGNVGIWMWRDATSTGNKLFVDEASLTNAPTSGDVPEADALPAQHVVLATGNPHRSP